MGKCEFLNVRKMFHVSILCDLTRLVDARCWVLLPAWNDGALPVNSTWDAELSWATQTIMGNLRNPGKWWKTGVVLHTKFIQPMLGWWFCITRWNRVWCPRLVPGIPFHGSSESKPPTQPAAYRWLTGESDQKTKLCHAVLGVSGAAVWCSPIAQLY